MENKKYPPYLFDVDFDATALPPEPEVIEEAPPPPTFSGEELQAAREEGFAAGKAEGIAETNAESERQIGEILARIQNDFAALVSAQAEANAKTMRDSVRVASTIGKKLVPEYTSRHGVTEIESFAQATLSTLFAEAEVVVKVPEATVAELTERLEPIAMASGLAGKLKIVPDPSLGPADCKLEWGNGGAERNCEQLLAEIDAIIARFIGQGELPPVSEPASVQSDEQSVQNEAQGFEAPDGQQQTEADATELSAPAAPEVMEPDTPAAAGPLETPPADHQQSDIQIDETTSVETQIVAPGEAASPETIGAPQETPAPGIQVPSVEETQVSNNDEAPVETSPAPAALPGAIDATAPKQDN